MRRTIGIVLCVVVMQAAGAWASDMSASLAVMLTTDPRVTGAARSALVEEATRIWDEAGVQLTWMSPSLPRPSTVDTLRILAVPWPTVQPSRAGRAVLGELLRTDRSHAVVKVSLDEAERMAGHVKARWAPASTDRQIGLILGRAAAHEVGHYLLDSAAHADRGLMRARFDEMEFADPGSHAFDLDAQARAWVRQRLAQSLPLGPGAGAAPQPAAVALLSSSRP